MKEILGTIIALAIGVGGFFLASEYLTENQQYFVRKSLNLAVQIGLAVAFVLVARRNKKLSDLLKKHGIDEKSNV